ncbi:hypothetical protein CLOBOL_06086 [Enterocloster bolteae ATCC BAA-613]|uniref:Uncharacterized protein n=1 Tax=Enterocloster bolteae (strain ATCC BAA-613 / DSM 15670 / CCUG 46953 / JCM 12243 / WAL 16351) TaxID=411902 RepID=A8S1L0_ENTBW|nr:hypothetical protein CLOBOL_06086 [Enterocloster bolteae ATCC BAA-613]
MGCPGDRALFLFWGQLKEEFFVFYCFTREIGHVLLWNLA